MPRDLDKELRGRLKGWKLLPDGRISYLPYIESAVFPMAEGVALALRFEARRKGQDDKTPEQFQFGLSPQQSRHLAAQLIECAKAVEAELSRTGGKPH